MAGGGMAAGAAAGSAFGPWGTVIGAAAGAAMDMSEPKPTAPVLSDPLFGPTNISFDQGQWNVAFPGSSIKATSEKTLGQTGATLPGLGAGAADPYVAYMPYILGVVGLVIAWKVLKKS